jgi:hypothetical protein
MSDLIVFKRRRQETVSVIDLTLPEYIEDIAHLHFNRTYVTGIFRKNENDNWYCCDNILFMSARNNVNCMSHDCLYAYLHSWEVRRQIASYYGILCQVDSKKINPIEIALPLNAGTKKYNNTPCDFWLATRIENQSYSASIEGQAIPAHSCTVLGVTFNFRICTYANGDITQPLHCGIALDKIDTDARYGHLINPYNTFTVEAYKAAIGGSMGIKGSGDKAND